MRKHQKPSQKTVEEAAKIARATQKPKQTKEQTKLIAQGIQKGIEQYKKQQKAKARELDKRLKQARNANMSELDAVKPELEFSEKSSRLPWILLAVSWALFIPSVLYLLN